MRKWRGSLLGKGKEGSRDGKSAEAYQAAVKLLSFRRRTAHEIRTGLEKRGFFLAEIEGAIERLIRVGLIDDARFAQDWALSRAPNKLWGRERIRQELLSRGISIDHIAEAVRQVYSEYPEEELALRAARKKWKSVLARDSLKARQKVGSYLQRQGFPFEMIIKALDGLKD